MVFYLLKRDIWEEFLSLLAVIMTAYNILNYCYYSNITTQTKIPQTKNGRTKSLNTPVLQKVSLSHGINIEIPVSRPPVIWGNTLTIRGTFGCFLQHTGQRYPNFLSSKCINVSGEIRLIPASVWLQHPYYHFTMPPRFFSKLAEPGFQLGLLTLSPKLFLLYYRWLGNLCFCLLFTHVVVWHYSKCQTSLEAHIWLMRYSKYWENVMCLYLQNTSFLMN